MADSLDRLLPIARVTEITGLSRAMIYRKIQQGTFPAPYKPGGVASRWSETELREWLTRLASERAARIGQARKGNDDELS